MCHRCWADAAQRYGEAYINRKLAEYLTRKAQLFSQSIDVKNRLHKAREQGLGRLERFAEDVREIEEDMDKAERTVLAMQTARIVH